MRSESSSHGLDQFLAEVPNFSQKKEDQVALELSNFASFVCFLVYIGSELDKGPS